MPNTDIPSHSYAVLDKLNIFLDKQKQYYSLYAFFLAMPLISKRQLPFKLRPRCGKLRHTNKKNLKIPPVKGLQAHLFILIRFHSVSLAGLGLFLGFCLYFKMPFTSSDIHQAPTQTHFFRQASVYISTVPAFVRKVCLRIMEEVLLQTLKSLPKRR